MSNPRRAEVGLGCWSSTLVGEGYLVSLWSWVPVTTESLPERPGEPECPGSVQNSGVSDLPERPSEPSCTFYLKTGTCKFGVTCKFHHPRDIQLPAPEQENGSVGNPGSAKNEMTEDVNLVKPLSVPALLHNSKGLPIRPGEVDCPFYLKTGRQKGGLEVCILDGFGVLGLVLYTSKLVPLVGQPPELESLRIGPQSRSYLYHPPLLEKGFGLEFEPSKTIRRTSKHKFLKV
ncbi:putative zinc finger CCCH domain-containing protein 37-like isoform X2 [Capsicum annuum]|nr:putative zinc finger CCCH domain-containing protein 37-like isoform X2 [Capsicum annuum]